MNFSKLAKESHANAVKHGSGSNDPFTSNDNCPY